MTSSTNQVAQLYREVILANAVDPVGHGREIEATHRAARNNPLCGDDIEIRLLVESGSIRDAAFTGQACAICLASASLLCAHLPGQETGAVSTTLDAFNDSLGTPQNVICPGYLQPLLGVRDYPARIACATLPWEAALAALRH